VAIGSRPFERHIGFLSSLARRRASVTPVSFQSDSFYYSDTRGSRNLLTVVNPTSPKELP